MKHGFYGQRLASGHLMVDLLSDDCCRALTQAREAALAATRPVEEPASDEEMAQLGAAQTNLRVPAEREASSSRRNVQVRERLRAIARRVHGTRCGRPVETRRATGMRRGQRSGRRCRLRRSRT
eukprot:7356515-Lingulodinium_polyedra.AAC.1